MNDVDEIATALNQVIEYLNSKGASIALLCTHSGSEFDDYGNEICFDCGITLEYCDGGDSFD